MSTSKRWIIERGLAAVFWLALALQGQQIVPSGRGQMLVTVKGEDGSIFSGADVFLRRTLPRGAPVKLRTDWSARAGADGVATFDWLPNGRYTLCAQARGSSWLNPCQWGVERPSVTLSAQRAVSTTLVLKRGAAVSIRVDDPNGLLAEAEGKAPGARLLLGVRSDAGMFHTASVAAKDQVGRNYSVTIPYNSRVSLAVASWYYRLTDGAGVPIAASGSATVPVLVPSGQAPPTVRLVVSGRR